MTDTHSHLRLVTTDTKPHRKGTAMLAVRRSGLELVPIRKGKRKAKIASAGFLAKLDFKPWPKSNPPDKPGRSAEFMGELGISARFAAAIVQRTKQELVNIHRTIDHEHIDQLMGNLFESAEQMKAMANMLEVACMRLLASTCANLAVDGEFKGVSSAAVRAAMRSEGLALPASRNGAARLTSRRRTESIHACPWATIGCQCGSPAA
jgi:hypothetical protein